MLCEECQTNEAAYSISVVAGGEMRIRHLCGDCMARMNRGLSSGDIKTLLSSILSAITGAVQPPEAEDEEEEASDVLCPSCQTTLRQFRRTGHLGCPACYQSFREQLQPMLLQIHGRVQHAGREPLNTMEAQAIRFRRQQLTRELEQAITAEDYETAARLRDRIRLISGEEDAL